MANRGPLRRGIVVASQLLLSQLLALFLAQQAASTTSVSVNHVRHKALRSMLQSAEQIEPASCPQPTPAGTYMDNFFATHQPGNVFGNFTKRSRTVVMFLCYDRGEIISQSFAALIKSDGIDDFDVIVSQDGGGSYVLDIPPTARVLYIRHEVNLCTGLHHYWVKRFAFDVMGYEELIVVEEDNVIHPQALQVLTKALRYSLTDPAAGLVSITDMDNAKLVNATRFSAALLSTEIAQGHLWVYAVHTLRYAAVRQHMRDYYNVIKCYDYRTKDQPPLSVEIQELRKSKGMPFENVPLSQDAFFVGSLEREGFPRRLTTLLRLFEPIGWQGLHFRQDSSSFFSVYGKGMYTGRVEGEPYDVTKDEAARAQMLEDCKQRLDALYVEILGRGVDEGALKAAEWRLMTGKLNAVELVHNMKKAAERHRLLSKVATATQKVTAA